jgi:hypothetical protein
MPTTDEQRDMQLQNATSSDFVALGAIRVTPLAKRKRLVKGQAVTSIIQAAILNIDFIHLAINLDLI